MRWERQVWPTEVDSAFTEGTEWRSLLPCVLEAGVSFAIYNRDDGTSWRNGLNTLFHVWKLISLNKGFILLMESNMDSELGRSSDQTNFESSPWYVSFKGAHI